jgi:hypothetical protein
MAISIDEQIFGNFDEFLVSEGFTAHLRVGKEMRSIWLDFVGGQELWEGSSAGTAMVFGLDGMLPRDFARSRGWSEKRRQRLATLRELWVVRVTELCTHLYP